MWKLALCPLLAVTCVLAQSKIDPLKLMAFVRTLEGAQFTPAGVLKVPLRSPANNPAGLIEELKTVLQELTFMTLKGLVKRIDGQTFARKR